MARNLILLALCFGALIWAAPQTPILPDRLSGVERTSFRPIPIEPGDRDLWDEYGLEQSESATYRGSGRNFTVNAWRLRDSTGAFAAGEWLGAAGRRAVGNYVLQFQGYSPKPEELKALASALPGYRNAALPSLPRYMPREGLVPGSERYVLGPVSLARFFPGVPAASAGFQFSGEAQIATYKAPRGEVKLAVFYYPTPTIGRAQLAEFEKLSGVLTKRSGPLVAVLAAPGSEAAGAALLDKVQYEVKLTWNERVPTRRDNVGDLIINAFLLVGILFLVCVGGGLAVGGVRAFAVRSGREPFTALHLEDRRA